MSENSLQALSALVIWAQAHSQSGPSATFRRDAIEQLHRQIGFDQAIWADAVISEGLSLRTAHLHNIKEQARGDFERAASADPRLLTVLSAPGKAHAYSVQPDDPELYRELVAQIDIGHFISICHFDPILGIASGVVLFGRRGRAPFTEDQRSFVEAAFPHLMTGWTRAQVVELERLARASQAFPRFSAVCRGPTLDAAEPEFLALLRTEWPDWTGPRLPDALTDPASGAAIGVYVGQRIVAHAKAAVDTTLMVVRERSVVDELTARERTVAELCAQGLTYREIAVMLKVAPATARNHLAAVHRRLGVTRNSEVAGLLAMAVAPWPTDRPA